MGVFELDPPGGYTAGMRMGRLVRRGEAFALIVAGFLAVSCAQQQQTRPYFHDETKDLPVFSAARLGDPWGEDSPIDFLEPEQQEAVERAGLSGWGFDGETDLPAAERAALEHASEPQGAFGRFADKVAKVSVVLLGVGVTLGMLVAPFFLD
jgi:hypothetical protein